MQLRRATDDDVPLLAYWDTKSHVIFATGADQPPDWHVEIVGEPGILDVFIAEANEQPIGVVQISDPRLEPSHYWGDVGPHLRAIDIWIGEESDLGNGLGATMMELALAHCFELPEITAVIIDPRDVNTRAHRFFARIGFEVIGLRMFDHDRCLVHQLTRERWNLCRSVQSSGTSLTRKQARRG